MDDTLRSLYQNRIVDLERAQRDIRARRYQERKAGKLTIIQGRMLAFSYYLAHKEESRARDKLGYRLPRPLPPWVRMHVEDSILQYMVFGDTKVSG